MKSMRILVRTAVCTHKDYIMFLQEINSSTVQRNIGKLFKMAYKKPTLITRQGNQMEGVVVMSKKHYAKLIKLAELRDKG